MTAEELSRVLSAAGAGKITAEQIRADMQAGAPANRDGMHLVHYAAWLIRNET